jgi:serine protease Do
LKVGDVIIEMGGKKVANANDVRNAVAAAETGGKRTVLLRLKSGDVARFVTLPVGRG